MNVLIVDNVKVFQKLVSSLFRDLNLSPVVCETGNDCLDLLATNQYAFICVSMYLSDTTGIELAKKIRQQKNYRHIPIILLTSESSPDLLKQAMTAGITETFNKHNDLEQLVAYIQRFTQQHRTLEGNILFVEDSAFQRSITCQILESRGLKVDAYESAEEGWEAFQKKDYHLVITDIVLSGTMSGINFVNKIRRLDNQKGDTPILAISGFDDIARRIELFHLGIDDYAIKPIIAEELIARVRYLINSAKIIEQQVQILDSIFNYTDEGILITDKSNKIIRANQPISNMSGYAISELLGKKPSLLRSPKHNQTFYQNLQNQLKHNDKWHGKIWNRTKAGQDFKAELSIFAIKNHNDFIVQYILIYQYL